MQKTTNFTHLTNIESFIEDNIELINGQINVFKKEINDNQKCNFDVTSVKNFLKNKIFNLSVEEKESLLNEFSSKDFKNKEIIEIANKHFLYKSDLEALFCSLSLKQLFNSTKEGTDLDSEIVNAILDSSSIDSGMKKFVSKILRNIVNKSLIVIRENGFSNNVVNVESGVQTANAGDSAQFFFIARAILAGFNCSNVDVRSSRYDAVIDYKGLIFKVQVKGVSGTSVSFKDRDRGGRGIDTHNERNQGKRITSKDCDLYVAVDKQVGICYLIPMKKFVDTLTDDQIKSYKVANLEEYRENWEVIEGLYHDDPRSSSSYGNIVKSIDSYKNGEES